MSGEFAKFLHGFVYAARGVVCCLKTQRNMRFHLCAAGAVIFLSVICGFDRVRMAAALLAVSSVMTAEAVNTAVESTVDLVTSERSPLAERAKDCAAGAVLIASVIAAAVGVCLFADSGALSRAAEWFAANPWGYIAVPAYAVFSVIFVFSRKE